MVVLVVIDGTPGAATAMIDDEAVIGLVRHDSRAATVMSEDGSTRARDESCVDEPSGRIQQEGIDAARDRGDRR